VGFIGDPFYWEEHSQVHRVCVVQTSQSDTE